MLADQGPEGPAWIDEDVAEAVDVSVPTVENIRKRMVSEGLEAAVNRKKQVRASRRARLLDGRQEAKLVALCCSAPPKGRSRWMDASRLGGLADQIVALEIVDSISISSGPSDRRSKKRSEAVVRRGGWSIPPHANVPFVCAMENILEVYHQPYDPKRPRVCMDETNKQLVKETRLSIEAEPGQPERFDYEYQRNGTANIFMFCEPLRGWRHVNVTDRPTKIDFAHQIKELLEVHYPDATCVRLVMDNLNTHSPSSLYEAFEPAEAPMLMERFEIIHTPTKHGSRLNIAEIQLNVLGRQCLKNRRVPDQPSLGREIAAWESSGNANETPVDWQFTTDDARIKLR